MYLEILVSGREAASAWAECNVDQANQGRHFNERADDAYKCLPEFSPKTATATAIANSKLLPAAVNESVADCA